MRVPDILQVVEESLNEITDRKLLQEIQSKLVAPRLINCTFSSPQKNESIPCWVVAELEQTSIGMVVCVYCDAMSFHKGKQWGYAVIDRDYFLGELGWFKDLHRALLEWSGYRDRWFQPKKSSMGCELDWYGCDIHGNVGLFANAGFGEIPKIIFETSYEFARVESFLTIIQLIQPEINGFDRFSATGLFVYDWRQGWDGIYQCIAKPENPLNIESFNSDIQRSLNLLKFEAVDFANQRLIAPANWFKCWPVW